jgi:nicotinamide riboside kinase
MKYKIAFTGPESSGKTTMAKWAASYFSCGYIKEYAREYLEDKTGYSMNDIEMIANRQFQLNNDIAKPAILDTEMLVLKIWFQEKYQMKSEIIQSLLMRQEIDYYFLCKPDIPWIEDPLRENPLDRDRLLVEYLQLLNAMGLPYTVLSGSIEQRKKQIKESLQQNLFL